MNGHKRRNPAEISYAILRSAQGGQKKTRIMYQSALNLKQLNLYLEKLAQIDLIFYEPRGKVYLTTEKGRVFAKAFEHFKETNDLLDEQHRAMSKLLEPKATSTVEVRP